MTNSLLIKKVGVPLAPDPLAKNELKLTILVTDFFVISMFNLAALISRSSMILLNFALF